MSHPFSINITNKKEHNDDKKKYHGNLGIQVVKERRLKNFYVGPND